MNNWKKLPGAPLEEQVFAIGDVHGQAKALRRALAKIKDTPRNGMPSHLIFTGDIIDRGPENLDCIAALRAADGLAKVDKVTFLPGNHELMLLEAVRQPHWGMNLWAQNGGMAVINEVDPQRELQHIDEVARALEVELAPFISLIDTAPDYLRLADILFVHGGISPHEDMDAFLNQGRDMPSKMSDHWAWIRDEFLYHEGGWDADGNLIVVHGHTPHNMHQRIDPAIADQYLDRVDTHHRICVDAGAAGMDQVALLEFSNDRYRITVTHEVPFDPALEDTVTPDECENEIQ
jgi:serine/threonine protein phosphatase 1